MTNAVADIEQETPEIGKERQLAGVGTGTGAGANNKKKPHDHALASILGPAFVAAVAYVDPGNVAANITSGARYGYLLVWVLVLANAMSVLIQYQSAKLGIVTNKSLPELLGERMSDAGRFMFFMQAEVIAIATDLAEVIDNTTSRGRTLRFLFDGSYEEFKHALFALGETPLPKWVREKVEPEDAERYQTIFAEKEGAVAAPTAGMHFSKHLMKRMEIKGIDKTFVTLHVGLGNFRTVDVEDLSKHKMDSEQFFVEEAAAEAVNAAKRQEHKVVAIGTTVMRTIETAVSTNGMIKPMEGWTNKFIFAPYEFTVADAMVTNLHLPYSTQLMMVAAFGGYETVMNAYKVAKEEGYRFGTYGDAMLIL